VLEDIVNKAFLIIEQWMNVNKLKMHAEKAKHYMIVRCLRREEKEEITLRCADGR